jgi:hypothetical protein
MGGRLRLRSSFKHAPRGGSIEYVSYRRSVSVDPSADRIEKSIRSHLRLFLFQLLQQQQQQQQPLFLCSLWLAGAHRTRPDRPPGPHDRVEVSRISLFPLGRSERGRERERNLFLVPLLPSSYVCSTPSRYLSSRSISRETD